MLALQQLKFLLLRRMRRMCNGASCSHLAVFVIEREGLARLDFIQNMEYKFVELLSVWFFYFNIRSMFPDLALS